MVEPWGAVIDLLGVSSMSPRSPRVDDGKVMDRGITDQLSLENTHLTTADKSHLSVRVLVYTN